jgi:hypothetical protein
MSRKVYILAGLAATLIVLSLPQVFWGSTKKFSCRITSYDTLTRLLTIKINPILSIPPDFLIYHQGRLIGDLIAPENMGNTLTGIFKPYKNFVPSRSLSGMKIQIAYPGGKIPGIQVELQAISLHPAPPSNCSVCTGDLIKFKGGKNKGIKVGSYLDLYSGHTWTANGVIEWVGTKASIAKIILPLFSKMPITSGVVTSPPQRLTGYSSSTHSSWFSLYRVNAAAIPSVLQNSLRYSDQHIAVQFMIQSQGIQAVLTNNGNHPLKFIWKDCEYIDPKGNSHKLIPVSKFPNKSQTSIYPIQQPLKTSVQPGKTKKIFLISQDKTKIGVILQHSALPSSTIRVIFMLQSNGTVLPYQFFFADNKAVTPLAEPQYNYQYGMPSQYRYRTPSPVLRRYPAESSAACAFPVTINSNPGCIYQALIQSGYIDSLKQSIQRGEYPSSYLLDARQDPANWLRDHPYLYSSDPNYFKQ